MLRWRPSLKQLRRQLVDYRSLECKLARQYLSIELRTELTLKRLRKECYPLIGAEQRELKHELSKRLVKHSRLV